MHFVKPESQQILDREAESAHRHRHHAVTRYEPDHYEDPDEDAYDYADKDGHFDQHNLDSHHHRDASQRATEHHALGSHHQMHGLPVHDKYGKRTIDYNPYQHEFVHGTNYELGIQRAAPVIEHNAHAFSETKHLDIHTPDLKKIAAPKEALPKKEAKKTAPAEAEKK